MSAAAPLPTPPPDLGAAILERLDRIAVALERSGVAPGRDPDELLSVAAISEEYDLDRKTIRAAIHLGRLRAANAGVRLTRVRRRDVDAWLAGRSGSRGAA